MRACFDGRGRVELLPGRANASQQRRPTRSPTRSAISASLPRTSAVSASGSSTNAMTARRPAAALG
ncbi:hypothetical protein [Streptomyces prunicolor]